VSVKLAGQDGTQIAKNLNDIIPQNAELTKVSLVSCNSATCAGNNTSLVIMKVLLIWLLWGRVF
jgi:hypothetical protein